MSYLFFIVIVVITSIYNKFVMVETKKLKLSTVEDLSYYKSNIWDFIYNFVLTVISIVATYFAIHWFAKVYFGLWVILGVSGIVKSFLRLKSPKIKYSDTL